MPSTMIHLLTGLALTRSSNIVADKSQFFLGCVAPDAVSLYSFAPKPIRWAAHFRSPDLDQWAQNAVDFYTDNINNYNIDFLRGYVLHAFCDLAWDKRYEPILQGALAHLCPDIIKDARWDEFYSFDKTQFAAPWWKHEVMPLLAASTPADINNIKADQLADFKAYILSDYEKTLPTTPPKVVTSELVNEFIYYAVATFKNEM